MKAPERIPQVPIVSVPSFLLQGGKKHGQETHFTLSCAMSIEKRSLADASQGN
jgi:hypothetical protein